MSRTLIVGYGYLGKELSKVFLKNSNTVYAIKRNLLKAEDDTHFIFKDIAQLEAADIPNDINTVIYCPSADNNTKEEYQHTYIDCFKHFLNILKNKPSKPNQIFYISSTGVYEVTDGSWVDEKTECNPKSTKSKILLEGEKIASNSGFETTIIRFSGIYGPERHPLLNKVLEKNALPCYDTRYSNRIHVTDCARVIYHLSLLHEKHGLYIATDCEPSPINTIVSWLSSTLGISLPNIKSIESAEPETPGGNKRCNNAKLLHTGYRFEYPNYHQGFKDILLKKKLITNT